MIFSLLKFLITGKAYNLNGIYWLIIESILESLKLLSLYEVKFHIFEKENIKFEINNFKVNLSFKWAYYEAFSSKSWNKS